ncbi:cyclin-dependent kinase F-4-like isoform X2 [Nymphaea colorata]|uniref:cyclin-dependent kinase F-4-like isoform X2 n=1 Tax=Nymphaea colorata TaxID=210225 RepID=UPI00214F2FBC|nr:cyclin-dependent kinase F-4-like isoform X2 [Nymphaea colorata]
MDKYKALNGLGEGTYGNVWKAINCQTGETVAIKKLKKKYYSWEECLNLREVQSLRKLNHPNIVKLKELIRENNLLYFVFEYMECNLYEVMKTRSIPFTEAEVRNWCFQVFQALAYMHQCGYFHRDLKPENLLVTKDAIKIADFGLAREVLSQPPYTNYVSTRWYRAPEVLLQAPVYSSSVDMWAMGAIMAELFTLQPLFPGSSELDEIYKICSVLGSPGMDTWPEGLQLANLLNYQFPLFAPCQLSILIPSASKEAIDLISSLCSWDPKSRPTAAEALRHSFFQPCFYIPPPLRQRSDSSFMNQHIDTRPQYAERRKGAAVQRTGRRYTEAPFTIEASYASYSPMQSTSNTGIRRAFAGDTLGVHVNKKATAAASRQMGYHYEMNYKSGFGYVGGVTSKNILDAPLNRSRRMPYLPSACAPGNAECSNIDTKGSHASAALSSWYRRDILGPGPGHIPGLSEAAC